MTLPKKVISENFIKEVLSLVESHNMDYMDAVIHYCEQNNIEIDAVAAIIKNSPIIKSKIQDEAEELNYLPKTNKLPI